MSIDRRDRMVLRLALSFFILAALLLGLVPTALAEPQAITQARADAQALQARLDKLNGQLETLVEAYDAADTQLSQTKAAAADTESKLKRSQQDLSTVQKQLADRLVQVYKQGNVSLIDSVIGASTFSDLVNRWSLLTRVGAQDSQLVSQVSDYRSQVEARKATLAAQLKQQTAYAAQVKATKAAVQKQLAENQAQLKGKEQQIAQLVQAEQARQAALAAQARAAAAAAAKQAAQAAQARAAQLKAQAKARLAQAVTPVLPSPGSSNSTSAGSGSSSDQGSGSVPASGLGAKAVQLAMKYLGVPYVWAGASPGGFDCSGLVMYVYAQLGVYLPHSSAMQYGCGTHVSRSQLEPGDLVFFGSPIHHVGMYVGNGNMIDAPYSGVSVRIDPLQSNYTGATRVG
jgi:peptidoglycan DL-endopeptidase CwlO